MSPGAIDPERDEIEAEKSKIPSRNPRPSITPKDEGPLAELVNACINLKHGSEDPDTTIQILTLLKGNVVRQAETLKFAFQYKDYFKRFIDDLWVPILKIETGPGQWSLEEKQDIMRVCAKNPSGDPRLWHGFHEEMRTQAETIFHNDLQSPVDKEAMRNAKPGPQIRVNFIRDIRRVFANLDLPLRKLDLRRDNYQTSPILAGFYRDLMTQVRTSVQKASYIVQLMMLLTMVNPINGMQDPLLTSIGDQVHIGDMRVTLHATYTGIPMISIRSTMQDTSYGYSTHRFDYSEAMRTEEKLESLLQNLEKGKPAGGRKIPIRPNPKSMAVSIKEACDCPLAANPWEWESQPETGSWVANHLETPGVGCPMTQAKDSYEVTIATANHSDNGCLVNPTPMTLFSVIQPIYKLSAQQTMEMINREAITPCVTQGAYNLNQMPDSRYKELTARHMLECQLQCRFTVACTAWMYQDITPPKCWAIRTGRLRFQFSKGKTAISYTGSKECLPCQLNKVISVESRGKWLPVNDECRLHTTNRSPDNLNCPCQNQLTYGALKEEVTRVNLKAQANVVEKDRSPTKGKSLMSRVAHLIRSMDGQGNDHETLKTLLKGGANLAQLSMQMAGWDVPTKLSSIDTLEPVKRLKELLIPAYKVVTQLVKSGSVKSPTTVLGRPGLTVSTNPFASLYKSKTDFKKFFQGSLQTNKAIKNALQGVDNFLQEASMQKAHQMTNPRDMIQIEEQIKNSQQPMCEDSNTLIISGDMGAAIDRIAIYPIQEETKSTQVLTLPVPTQIPDTLTEPSLPLGTTEFDPQGFFTNWHRSTTHGCMMQLAEGKIYPNECRSNRPNRPLREISVLPVKGNTSYKAIRIARPGNDMNIFRLSCGKSAHFLELKGMSVLLVGPKCHLRDMSGNLLSGPWGESSSSNLEDYMILYDEELTLTDDKLVTDRTHHAIIAGLICSVIALVIERVYRWIKRCQVHNPHPEANSPTLPRMD